jgi:hypothetical protein
MQSCIWSWCSCPCVPRAAVTQAIRLDGTTGTGAPRLIATVESGVLDCGDVADWDSAADAATIDKASVDTIAQGLMIALHGRHECLVSGM